MGTHDIETSEPQRVGKGIHPWFDIVQWNEDIVAGVSLNVREARARAEWPEYSADIRRWFLGWKKHGGK